MQVQTPVECTVASYWCGWPKERVDQPGLAKVNPETLGNGTPPEFAFRYIDISSVSEGVIDWQSVPRVTFADSPSRAHRVVRQGDSLICTVRPLLRSHTFAVWVGTDTTICSTGFAVVRCAGSLLPSFVKHLPFAEQVVRQLVAWQCGTSYPAVNERDIRQLVVPVPPLEEQAAISRILDAVDTAMERTREAVVRACELDHSLLHELLEKGVQAKRCGMRKRPEHWCVRRVDEVAEVGSGVTLGKDVSGFKSVEMPYLRVANVQDGHLDLSTIKTVRVRVDEVSQYRLEPGDVLMTEGGDIDKLGHGAMWDGQIPDCLHQNHIFRIRANRKVLEPEFYAFVVESDIAKRYFMRVAKRTTNLASTNKTQVRAFRFPLPPLDEQRRIIAVIKACKGTVAGLTQKEKALRELKAGLMHDLLTGQMRVKNLEKVLQS